MNKYIAILLALVPTMIFSQWSLMSESFDEYNPGELLNTVGASNGWGTWTGLDAESCVVSADEFLSGTNSGHVFDDGTTNGRATWSWSDYNEGKFSFYSSIYVPLGSAGGFIGFHDSLNTEMPHSISILGDTSLLFLDWEAFSYIEATGLSAGWHEIQIIFDLDNATSEFILDQVSVGVMGTSFGLIGGISFGSIEFGAYAYNPFTGAQPAGDFYIEDLNLVDELSLVGVSEAKNPVLTLAPNPSNGSFSINFEKASFVNARLTVIDMTGSLVYTTELTAASGIQKYDTNLDTGIYLIKVADATKEWSSRIVIK